MHYHALQQDVMLIITTKKLLPLRIVSTLSSMFAIMPLIFIYDDKTDYGCNLPMQWLLYEDGNLHN